MPVGLQLMIGFGVMVTASVLLGSGSRLTNQSFFAYFWGDNKIKKKGIVHLLLSDPFSMNGILYQTWLGYIAGISAIWMQVIWCLSYILLGSVAKKIEPLSHSGTLHGNIGSVFGHQAARAAAFALFRFNRNDTFAGVS